MVSILIGHNNLCAFCNDADANGPETFGRLLEKSVDVLYEQVPRVFVNLLSPVDVTALYPASEGPHPPPRRTRYLAPSTHDLRISPVCAALLLAHRLVQLVALLRVLVRGEQRPCRA